VDHDASIPTSPRLCDLGMPRPLPSAYALGHVDAAAVLLDAGADASAGARDGTATAIAEAQRKQNVVAVLDRRAHG